MHLCRSQSVTEHHDIIIIGAGLIGLCTADELSARGLRVCVIDARPGPCEGTSFSNSGMIHPSQKMEALGLPKGADGCLQLFPDIETARAAQSRFSDIGIQANILMNVKDTFGHAACQFPDDSRHDDQFYIKTADNLFSADQCVIAAGADSVRCLAQLDLRLSLNAVAGTAADFELPTQISELPNCPIMDVQSRSALTVFSDRIRISGGWGLKDPKTLIDRWNEIAPELMVRLGFQRSKWTGLRPVSPVGRPYISATSIPGLWINTGHGHMGWTLCAGSGELLSKMIIDGHQDQRFAYSG